MARVHGRSAYVCASIGCVQRAVQRRALTRSLHHGGRIVRELPGVEALISATERALDREIDVLSRTGAACPRLPQLQTLVRALRPERTT